MKVRLLYMIGMVSFLGWGQTVIPIANLDFETGVDATTWDGSTTTVQPAVTQSDWTGVTSGNYRGTIHISSTSVNGGSGALEIVTTTKGGSSGNGKLTSSEYTYTPAYPIIGVDLSLSFYKISPTSTNNNKPKFYVEYSIDSGAWEELLFGKLNTNTGSYVVQSISKEISGAITTDIKVRILLEFGKMDAGLGNTYIDDISLTLTEKEEALSTGQIDPENGITGSYPNPVTDNLYFTNDASKTVVVSNLSGQQLIVETVNGAIDLSGLQSGIYFVQITDEETGTVSTKKIVKK